MISEIGIYYLLCHCSCAHNTAYLVQTIQQLINRENVENVFDY